MILSDPRSSSQAFEYIWKNGICSKSYYPYVAIETKCLSSTCAVAATLRAVFRVPPGSEEAFREAGGCSGPIAVSIASELESLQHHKGGIYVDADAHLYSMDSTTLSKLLGMELRKVTIGSIEFVFVRTLRIGVHKRRFPSHSSWSSLSSIPLDAPR